MDPTKPDYQEDGRNPMFDPKVTELPHNSRPRTLKIVFALIMIGISVAGIVWVVVIRSYKNASFIGSDTPTPTLEQVVVKEPTTMLAIDNRNVVQIDIATNARTLLTHDGVERNSYINPAWLDDTTWVATRCQDILVTGNTYKTACFLEKHEIGTESVDILVAREAKPDKQNYYKGGYIGTFGVSPDRTKIAFMTESYPGLFDADTYTSRELHILDVATKEDVILQTFRSFGGRGGMLDDEERVTFSPDNTKLLVTLTGLYPGAGSDDTGTMFVFDEQSGTLIWQKQKALTTYGRWLNTTTVLAKQIFTESQSTEIPAKDVASLIRIDLSAGKTEIIGTIQNWFDIVPINDHEFYFYSFKDGDTNGIQMEKYDITTKTRSVITDQLRPLRIIGNYLFGIQFTSCMNGPEGAENDCGMDMFHGYTSNAYVLRSLTTSEDKVFGNGWDWYANDIR